MWELTTSSRFMPAHGPSGKCVRTFEGHKDFVLSVALTPHGDWVLSGSKDRGVQFWDPHTGVAQLMLQGHKNSGMLNTSSFTNIDLTLRSHLSGSQPNWRCFRDGQRRHARPYLEVSHSAPFPIPQTLYMFDTVRYSRRYQTSLGRGGCLYLRRASPSGPHRECCDVQRGVVS
jgi:hypothetical protein